MHLEQSWLWEGPEPKKMHHRLTGRVLPSMKKSFIFVILSRQRSMNFTASTDIGTRGN